MMNHSLFVLYSVLYLFILWRVISCSSEIDTMCSKYIRFFTRAMPLANLYFNKVNKISMISLITSAKTFSMLQIIKYKICVGYI